MRDCKKESAVFHGGKQLFKNKSMCMVIVYNMHEFKHIFISQVIVKFNFVYNFITLCFCWNLTDAGSVLTLVQTDLTYSCNKFATKGVSGYF